MTKTEHEQPDAAGSDMIAQSPLKVPKILAFFWIVKVATTAMGESVSDFLVSRYNPVPIVVLGFAGILGDLAESLIKRDGNTKDASQAVPGFGGLLDVFDSVLFAGPVAYLWFNGQDWLIHRAGLG